MSEDLPARSSEAPGSVGGTAVPVGRRLALAREARGLALADVGAHLKVGPKKIEAIEANDWQSLLPLPYLRGFVRNYAKLVQLDPEPLLAEIDLALGRTGPDAVTPLTMAAEAAAGRPARVLDTPFYDRHERRLRVPALGKGAGVALLIVVLVALAAWFAWQRETGKAGPAEGPAVDAPAGLPQSLPPPDLTPAQPAAPAAPAANGAGGANEGGGAAGVPNPGAPNVPAAPTPAQPAPGEGRAVQALPAPVSQAVPAPVPVPGGGGAGTLVLRFADQSWTEVRQGDGSIVFSQLNRAGSEKSLSGTGPFDLVIGNPATVTLLHNGSLVDLAPYTRQNVARLRLK